jgi:hypothetical protein
VVLDIKSFCQGRHDGMVKAFAATGAMGLQGGPETSRQAQMQVVYGIRMADHGAQGKLSG